MKTLIAGVGGAGTHVLKTMKPRPDCTLLAVNTDASSLNELGVTNALLIGQKVCGGLSSGGLVRVGCLAAEESSKELEAVMTGCQRLVVIAGFGGGTGTGSAPVIAELGRQLGLQVVLVAMLPFAFEQARRELALQKLKMLEGAAYTIQKFDNESLMQGNTSMSLEAAFLLVADKITKNLSDLLW